MSRKAIKIDIESFDLLKVPKFTRGGGLGGLDFSPGLTFLFFKAAIELETIWKIKIKMMRVVPTFLKFEGNFYKKICSHYLNVVTISK